jgi:hypothetical protein
MAHEIEYVLYAFGVDPTVPVLNYQQYIMTWLTCDFFCRSGINSADEVQTGCRLDAGNADSRSSN